MNHYSKQQAMNNQPRSFVIGTVECVDSQWIFFEDESDEASMLHEVMDETLELLIDTRWEKAIMVDDRQIKLHDGTYLLRNGDKLRLTKSYLMHTNSFFNHYRKRPFIIHSALKFIKILSL